MDRMMADLKVMKDNLGIKDNNSFAQILVASGQAQVLFPNMDVAQVEEILNNFFKIQREGGFAKRQQESIADNVIDTSRDKYKSIKSMGVIARSGMDPTKTEIGKYNMKSARYSLFELQTGLEQAGASPERIAEILAPLRDPVYNARGRTLEERQELFESRREAVEDRIRVEVTTKLAPDASRIFDNPASSSNWYSHTRGSGGSQYAGRPPATR